jgi:hypothetical protein
LPRNHHIDSKHFAWGEDPMTGLTKRKISHFTIRTSGRRVFRRCLRKWGFQSSMKMNLQGKGTEKNIHFWFGSAIHFAMEDYFGYNKFGSLQRAFQAYYAAFPAYDRPAGADENYYLGLGMLEYFSEWYPKHNLDHEFSTVWLDENKQEVAPGTEGAHPLIENSFMLDLGVKVWVRDDTEEIAPQNLFVDDNGRYYFEETAKAGDPNRVAWLLDEKKRVYVSEVPIYYHGTLDRIVKDRQGRWWIMDWKTAKSADTNKLDTDDQISAYMWAAEQWFGHSIHGFVYVQLTKDLAKAPKRLTTGLLSTDKKQKTTYNLFRAELIKDYGEVRKATAKMLEFLNILAAEETPEGDRFIRWDLVTRNKAQKIATYHHILAEVRAMITPEMHLYPNPTRDCIWDCNFRDACLMMDRGEQHLVDAWIEQGFEQRPREEDGNIDDWRKNIPWPDSAQGDAIGTLVEQIELSAGQALNLILPDKYKEEI